MKTATIFISTCLLLTAVKAYTFIPREQLEQGNGRILILIDNDNKPLFLNRAPPRISYVDVDETEVTFYYRSRNFVETELITFTVDDILETDFDPQRRTMFIIHGWNNDKNSMINTLVTDALLAAEDWNIFVVDWRDKAHSLYNVALGAVPGVGDVVAKYIQLLMEKTGTTVDKINLCGHSLGAHVCGRVGHLFGGQIDTIVALDPALPFVSANDIDSRLDPTDATYVQVIHTNGGLLGFLKPIGHSDFYPNGGMSQKGCGLDMFGKCAHSRSYIYFAESIVSNSFHAKYCESNADWKSGACDDNEISYMGGNNLNRVYGTFYLDTKQAGPFGLGQYYHNY